MASSRRLAPGLTWPVKHKHLLEVLRRELGDDAGGVGVVYAHWEKQSSDLPLSATWTPSTKGFIGGPFDDPGPAVWVRAVSTSRARDQRDDLDAAAEEAAAWVARALAATDSWKLTHHERRWQITATGLSIRDSDGIQR